VTCIPLMLGLNPAGDGTPRWICPSPRIGSAKRTTGFEPATLVWDAKPAMATGDDGRRGSLVAVPVQVVASPRGRKAAWVVLGSFLAMSWPRP